ncbi:MAG TPA: hypothetical protein VN722_02940 [Hanamia sp.]|nr:hypothetical protein [Hanamia sp.]
MEKANDKILNNNSIYEKEIKDIVCQAIKDHKPLYFYYESGSGKYWRKVEPYLLANRKEGEKKAYFTGYVYPEKGRIRKNENDSQGQYLIDKIDRNKFKVLDETFNSLKVDYKKIYGELPTVEIICRVEGLKVKLALAPDLTM